MVCLSFVLTQCDFWKSFCRGHTCKNAQNKSIIANVCHQILGADLNSPVHFVISWTEDGSQSFHEIPFESGPVYFGIKLASSLGIPVFNLGSKTWRDRFIAYLDRFENSNLSLQTLVGHVDDEVDTYIGRNCYGFKESIFANSYKLSDYSIKESLNNYYESIKNNDVKFHLAKMLKGKKLGCYCRRLGQESPACHGDILAAISNKTSIEKVLEGSQPSLI